jgi:hypothetical protein
VDIPNVIRYDLQMLELDRPARISIDVSDVAVLDAEAIDFEWIDALQRLLPALLFDTSMAGFLGAQLRQINAGDRL